MRQFIRTVKKAPGNSEFHKSLPNYGSFMRFWSSFWRLQFGDGSYIFLKICGPQIQPILPILTNLIFYITLMLLCGPIVLNLTLINHLKPTGYVMHQQFNIQQLYVLPTLYICVLYLSENKQRLVPFTS